MKSFIERAQCILFSSSFSALILAIPANAQFVIDSEYNAQGALATINAAAAYGLGLTGQGIKVGVVDTGINSSHTEFGGQKLEGGWDYFTQLVNSNIDPDGHGSHVGGIIGAHRDGVGMHGVAYNSTLVNGRGLNDFGSGNSTTLSSAIDYTVAAGVRVVNNSWGTPGCFVTTCTVSSTFMTSFTNAVESDVVLVFAAGNSDSSQVGHYAGAPYYHPELKPNWIAVAASDVTGNSMAWFTNACGVAADWCITAPGASIYSVDGTTNSGYTNMSGTSMAAPHVSGAVALVAESFPWMTGAQLTSTVLTTASNANAPGTIRGRGDLDVGKAVQGPGILEFSWVADLQGYSSIWSNNISGAGSLTKSGTGTLTLNGSNTYSGGIIVSNGTFGFGSNSAAGTGTVTTTGSVLDYANGVTVSNLVNVNSNTTQFQVLTGSATQAGVISETGGARPIEKIGAGTLALTASNTYSGGTTISAGTLQIGSGGTMGSIAGNVTNNSTIAFNRSDSYTFAGIVSGTGGLSQTGTGTLILTAANTYSGGTTISAGTLQIGSGGTMGSIAGNVTNNSTIAFNRSTSHTFTGIVSGTGALTHTGTGTLLLTAANTYSGPTTVSSGQLIVNGSIATSSGLTVENGASFGGNGQLPAATISGTLSPGNSIGTATINGDLELTSLATYLADVTPTASDRINVTGNAAIQDSTLTLVKEVGIYNFGISYTLMNATGGVSGAFSNPSTRAVAGLFGPAIRSFIRQDTNNVQLVLEPNTITPYVPAGSGSNQFNVAGSVDNVIASGTAASAPAELTALFSVPTGALANDLSQLSGEIATAPRWAAFDSMRQFLSLVLDTGAGSRSRLQMTQEVPIGQTHVWGAVFGSGSTMDNTAVAGSHDLKVNGPEIATGLDYRASENLTLGAAVGGGSHFFSLSNALGSGRTGAFQFAVRGTLRTEDYYFSAGSGYAQYNVKTNRDIYYTGARGSYRASYSASGFGSRVEAGRETTYGAYGLTPFVAVLAEQFKAPAYTETRSSGGAMPALDFASNTLTRVRSEIGLDVAKALDIGNDNGMQFHGRIAWKHELSNSSAMRASFNDFPGAPFNVRGAVPGRAGAVLRGGISMNLNDRIAFRANIQGEFDDKSRGYGGDIGLRIAY